GAGAAERLHRADPARAPRRGEGQVRRLIDRFAIPGPPLTHRPTRHQREVGTSYFDAVSTAISAGEASTTAMAESTEAEQF
ncbi:MAG: hypothetical protein VW453_08520, partial [Rhodospirillaceae bacterium]